VIWGAAEWKPVARFYVLATAISWTLWSPLVLSRAGVGVLPFTMPMPWTIAGTLGPPLAAVMMWRREGRLRSSLSRLVRVDSTRAVGALAGSLVVAITFVCGTAAILSRHQPEGWQASAFALYGFHWFTTLLGGPIFEEWGWRGYAQARLQQGIGPLPAALAVGLGWGLWHLPLFLVPAWSSASLPIYVVMITLLSVLMAWGFNTSRGFIVASIAMHFTYNASSRVLGDFLGDADLRAWPSPVVAITLAFGAAALIVTVSTKGRLGAKGAGETASGGDGDGRRPSS